MKSAIVAMTMEAAATARHGMRLDMLYIILAGRQKYEN
jgi:hypothetical protein